VGKAPNATHLPLAQLEMFDCKDIDAALAAFHSTPGVAPLSEVLSELRSNMQLPYPQNVLRNVARRHCRSEWVACPDVDMVFPAADATVQPSWTQRLAQFLRSSKAQECGKCAFVLPLFEVQHENRTLPADKTQLRQYVDAGRARPYHTEVFVQNQAASKLNDWIKRPQTSAVDVAYSVQYKFWYEPVFIARHSAPKFDERYIGYGMTRNTQVGSFNLPWI
jgi:beta-1,4-glucuronyltransferase 1